MDGIPTMPQQVPKLKIFVHSMLPTGKRRAKTTLVFEWSHRVTGVTRWTWIRCSRPTLRRGQPGKSAAKASDSQTACKCTVYCFLLDGHTVRRFYELLPVRGKGGKMRLRRAWKQ